MLSNTIIALLFLALLISCTNQTSKPIAYSLKDSVLNEHLLALDAADHLDTTDINYKVLIAYRNNDTNFFKQLHENIEQEYEQKRHRKKKDSCIHQPGLQDLKADEAYRFIYQMAFCQYSLNVTVSKIADSASIHFIIYDKQWDTGACKIVNEFDKRITMENWEEFIQAIQDADFWGLKWGNGVYGLDGETLTVTGYVKSKFNFHYPTQINHVYRWGNSTLTSPFHLILKLSGNRQGCLVIY